MNINQEQYKKILESKEVALIDFWAEWCGPCKRMAPTIDKLEESFKGRAKVCKVDVEANPHLSSQLGIRSIPTLIVVKDGQVVESLVGTRSEQELTDLLNKHL